MKGLWKQWFSRNGIFFESQVVMRVKNLCCVVREAMAPRRAAALLFFTH